MNVSFEVARDLVLHAAWMGETSSHFEPSSYADHGIDYGTPVSPLPDCSARALLLKKLRASDVDGVLRLYLDF